MFFINTLWPASEQKNDECLEILWYGFVIVCFATDKGKLNCFQKSKEQKSCPWKHRNEHLIKEPNWTPLESPQVTDGAQRFAWGTVYKFGFGWY